MRNEIIASDENFLRLLVYDRLADTPPHAAMTEPKRIIGGSPDHPEDSVVQFPCGLYIDPKNGEIYVLSNDIEQTLSIFPRDAQGNVPPPRWLRVPIETFGVAVDEEGQEMYVTVQHPGAVLAFHKMAQANDAPIRILEGPRTLLADAHGIAIDTKNQWMFVSNHGANSYGQDGKHFGLMPHFVQGNGVPGWNIWDYPTQRRTTVPGSGVFHPSSITVHPLKASGDAPPIRVIQGPKTQLNWPAHIFLDTEHGELFVANDVGNSVLVFRATDRGDAAPLRVLKGPKARIQNPSGVYVDTKNEELVVSNIGNNAITVYPRTASGDTAPLRTIRSGPLGKRARAPILIKPGGVTYDTKREEILVPN